MINNAPIYNLKAVLKETGLKADVLRAWERRYELPAPHRTPGGHRLYSDYDIETIKWLHARQAEGLSISHAVELWKDTVAAGQDPLEKYQPVVKPPTAQRLSFAEVRIETLRQNWLNACLEFDNLMADDVLDQALSIYPVESVCTEILQQGINEIGNDWYGGKATVQQEHFASSHARRRLETLITTTPPPMRRQTVLLGCPPGEQHTLSVLLLNLFLRRRGLQVVYLGEDIPITQMAETAQAIQPNLIVLAAQQLATAAALRLALIGLQGLDIPLAYGGLIFNWVPGLREHIPAHFLGETLEAAILMIERLVVSPSSLPTPSLAASPHEELARLFQEQRPLIEAAVFENLHVDSALIDFIVEANSFFGSALSAALVLGDLDFIQVDLDWVQRLLTGHHLPQDSLPLYLTAYSRAIDKSLGKVGTPITAWIDLYLAQDRRDQ